MRSFVSYRYITVPLISTASDKNSVAMEIWFKNEKFQVVLVETHLPIRGSKAEPANH